MSRVGGVTRIRDILFSRYEKDLDYFNLQYVSIRGELKKRNPPKLYDTGAGEAKNLNVG